MHAMKAQKLVVGLCSLAAVGAAVGLTVGVQGCSSSNSSTGGQGGNGGLATGSQGGKTGAGGTTVAGQGGAGVDAGPPLCTGVAYAGAPLITDFSDVAAPEGGTGLRIAGKGGVYTYGGTSAAVTGGALAVTGTITAGTYAGAGLYFDSCIDATSYTGFSFKLTGDFGTCDMLKLGAQFPQVQIEPPASGFGVCPATSTMCYGPGSTYTTATTMVSFASMAGGGALATVTPAAQSRITGIDFGFHGPAAAEGGGGGCTVNFTIDDVKFY